MSDEEQRKDIRFASQSEVNRHWDEVEQVLEAIGHPEALVTDESRIWDFYGREADESALDELRSKLNESGISLDDRAVGVAKRIN